MAIDIKDLQKEFGAYCRLHNRDIGSWLYQTMMLAEHSTTVPKVKGEFAYTNSIATHVVQGFEAAWKPMGGVKFIPNILRNFHLKVNFPIIPSQILPSYEGALYDEKKKIQDMPISQFIMEKHLKPKVASDLEILSGNGVYDPTKLGQFGYSMDGLKKIIADGVKNKKSSMYRIPLEKFTDSNISSQVESFETQLPTLVSSMLPCIYMSSNNLRRYKIDTRNKYGTHTDYSKDKGVYSPLDGRMMIGLDCLNGSDIIFATPKDNLLKLIDMIDTPIINDIQIQDYEMKIFMEFWLGFNFYLNPLVMVGVFGEEDKGLLPDEDGNNMNELFFPEDYAQMPIIQVA